MFLAIRNWLHKPDLSKSIRETNEALNREVNDYATRAWKAEKEADEMRRKFLSARTDLLKANARLSRIAALETPRCAHVGRKMARIARGEG